MPSRAPRPCTQPGCPAYATKRGRCDAHQPKHGWNHGKSKRERYGKDWPKKKRVVLERDNYLCQTCMRAGRVTQTNQVDHIIPKMAGGRDSFDNLEAICDSCHKAKTAREAAEGRRRRVK